MRERRGVRVPEPAAAERLAGSEVKVEARRVGVPTGPAVRELGADVGLVRALILREPNVSVDAEHRATDRTRVGAEVGTDSLESRSQVGDEA
jgi:hypothetical protein